MRRATLSLSAVSVVAFVAGALLFLAPPALAAPQTLKVKVTGAGSVGANEGAISGCEAAAGTCEGQYEEATTITLTATPANERTMFSVWTGCTAVNGNECQVEVGASPIEVKSRFEPIPQQKLTVATAGTGTGKVTGTSPGPEFTSIDCGATCTAEYNQGATVILLAGPAAHSAFIGWTGCSSTNGTECQVEMTAAKSVKADFDALPAPATAPATEVTHTSATLNGKVNPDGVELTECFFEYGKTESYGEKAACEESAAQIGKGTSPVPVEAKITGLTADPTYHFRLVTANGAPETVKASDQTFNTVQAFSTSFAGTGPGEVPLSDPTSVEVDQSTGDVYVANAPSDEQQTVAVDATGGTYTLTFKGQTTAPIAFNASANEGAGSVQAALDALSTIGPGNVQVSGEGGTRSVEFIGAFADTNIEPIAADGSALTGGTVTVTVSYPGSKAADVEKFTASGEFLLIFGKEVNKGKVIEKEHGELITEAAQNVCDAGEQCQPGTEASTPGAFVAKYDNFGFLGSTLYLAVDNSTGPSAGDIYVGDPGDNLISKFTPEGTLIESWGVDGQLNGNTVRGGSFSLNRGLEGVAVDPTDGDLYVESQLVSLDQLAPNGSFLAGGEGTEEHGFSPSPYGQGIAADAGHLYGDDEYGGLVVYPQFFPGRYESEVQPKSLPPGGSPAIDPANHDLYVDARGRVEHYPATCIVEECSPLDIFGAGHLSESRGLAVNAATGAVYIANTGENDVAVFTAVPYLPEATPSAKAKAPTEELLGGEVNPAGAGEVKGCHFEYVRADDFQTLTLSAATGGTFSFISENGERHTQPIPFDVTAEGLERELESFVGLRGVGSATVSGPRGGPYTVEFTEHLGNQSVPSLIPVSSGLTPHGATAKITSNEPGDSWATATTASCEEPSLPYSGPQPAKAAAKATALTYGTAYDLRLTAENAAGSTTSFAEAFTTLPLPPTVGSTSASQAYAETAQFHTQIDPNGGEAAYHTSYHVEYLTSEQLTENEDNHEEEFAHADQGPSRDAGSARATQSLTAALSGLQPDTTYRYRVVAINECEPEKQCAVHGEAHTFTTLPLAVPPNDPCPNAHVRQQTSAAQLLDCRAYELVSAPHTAGYDVESNLIEGQEPYPGYPEAKTSSGEPKLLYGIHDGGIPGIGEPTNRGVDPYIATRTPEGWTTEYVGLPATGIPSAAPFGSPLLAADRSLDTLAFGGPGLCSPCFGSGIETGVPLHLPGIEAPVQGMVPAPGSNPPPAAATDGYIAQPLSANGEHLVFGSTGKFATRGHEDTGDVSIYDRNLTTGETNAVSETPHGGKLPCLQGTHECHSPGDTNGIAELAVSSDGSRVLLAQKVSEDKDHNVYWHLFMNVGDAAHTVDVTPGVIESPGLDASGFKEGVLFDGMTEDGSKVFFTTDDKLTAEDPEHSGARLYEAEVTEEGATLRLLSTGEGSAGNTASCDPVSNSSGPHWNTVGKEENCGVVAIGGGVAAQSGAIYFLSPEQLQAGHGTENQPNLYLAAPSQSPRFVATLSPDDQLVLDAVTEADTRNTADFQLTPNGRFAAFPSTLALAGNGEETAGHTVLYRYDAAAPKLACVSCTLTETPSTADSSLASNGLSLTDEGRVFFNSHDALVATDTDERQNVYEWEPQGTGNCEEHTPAYSRATESCRALISAGTSAFDSGLLSASADGTDVYFFTRDNLAPTDENGPVVKIYDAREGGGFPYVPPRADCKASDECHGPASSPPPPIEAGTGAGTPDNYKEQPKPKTCKHGFVLKHGKCVKKVRHERHKGKKHKHRAKKHRKGSVRS